MITTENIITEYPKLNQAVLPETLKKSEFDFIKENIDLYGQDKDIDEYINTFVAELNRYAGSKKETPKAKTVSKPKQKSKPKKQGTTTKVVAEPKPKAKAKKANKPKPQPKAKKTNPKRSVIETAPDWLLVIRKFLRLKNKTVTQTSARRLLNEIQTKFAANKNRKPTPYILLIRRMQNTIIEQSNENLNKNSFVLKVPKMFVSLLKQASATVIVKKTKNTKVKSKALSGTKKKSKTEKTEQKISKELKYLLDNAVKVEKKKYSISNFKKLIRGIETAVGKISMSRTEVEKLNKKFGSTKDRKRYFSFVEPTLKTPFYIIEDTDKSLVLVKAFIWLSKPFIAVIKQKGDKKEIVTLTVKGKENIENLLKRGTIVSPDTKSGKQPLKGDLEADKTPPILSQLSLVEFKIPFVLTKVGKKKKPVKQAKENLSGLGIVPTTELQKMKFKTLPFTGNWKKLIGNPSVPFHLMFYGTGGSGKSTISIQLAHYLAEHFDFKVLYVAKEEGISQTAQEKFKRFNAYHRNIFISDGSNLNRLRMFDVAVLDSVNELNLQPDDIRRIQAQNPKLSTIQIFKATKEGKFLGQNDFMHIVQAQFRCENGFCYPEKNRFGGNETIKINFK